MEVGLEPSALVEGVDHRAQLADALRFEHLIANTRMVPVGVKTTDETESESKDSEKDPVVTHRSQERGGGRHRNVDRNWLSQEKKTAPKKKMSQKGDDTKKEDGTKRKMTPTRR